MEKTLYSLDEIVLIPSVTSEVESRSQCNPFYEGNKLPLFIAPMSCLVDAQNYKVFEGLGFKTIVPRTVSWDCRETLLSQGTWVAIGVEEGYRLLKRSDLQTACVCIDIANGHQKRVVDLCKQLKEKFPDMVIMVGNIANPETYIEYAKTGVDYVRVGIGSGQVCTTSVQTGIHYPMASLVTGCVRARHALCQQKWPKIVADGGFGYIDQIVKALALGADYVMIGKIAASFPEACGDIIKRVDDPRDKEKLYREYYGMSTEKAQRLMHPEPNYVPKHTEGTVRYIPVIDSTQRWINDFTHALKSSMSYCNAFNLKEFVGQVKYGIQNPTTFNAYIKS